MKSMFLERILCLFNRKKVHGKRIFMNPLHFKFIEYLEHLIYFMGALQNHRFSRFWFNIVDIKGFITDIPHTTNFCHG